MNQSHEREPDPMRRALFAMGALTPLLASAAPAWAAEAAPPGQVGDFDFLVGRWRIRHHRLVGRLIGSTNWQDFDGEFTTQKLLGGQANVDDCIIELPAGTYRGVAVRVFDPQRRAWSIYWIDSRTSRVDPPMVGGFEGRHGVFYGDDQQDGRPVRVRFLWFVDDPDRLRWEQAMSADKGVTWETNWTQSLKRAA